MGRKSQFLFGESKEEEEVEDGVKRVREIPFCGVFSTATTDRGQDQESRRELGETNPKTGERNCFGKRIL